MIQLYLVLHIISIISWMVGLFYLPRLFVYHTTVSKDSETYKIFMTMERKLLRIIMNPAMIISFISGLLIISQNFSYYIQSGWLHAKFTLVLLLATYHGFLAKCRKNFVKNQNHYSEKFFRIINEVPTVLLIIIVVLVIYKPF